MTFSIRYETDDYTEYAVDWNWNIKGEWARSIKEGSRWDTIQGLDDKAYKAILNHFGLQSLEESLPLEKIITVSWEDLGRMRRDLEKKYGLPRQEIKSDTLGDNKRVP